LKSKLSLKIVLINRNKSCNFAAVFQE